MSNLLEFGWFLNNKNYWEKCEIIKYEEDNIYIRILSTEQIELLNLNKIKIANNNSIQEIRKMSNLINLRHLHEPSILYHVERRYEDNIIYTFTGDILLSVNPFKKLEIYDNNTIKDFHLGNLKYPHIFGISKNAYIASLKGDNQSVLISGESGAGKTVAAKYIMRYLTFVGTNFNDKENSIENKILCSNPILEAFGNSKTLRNDNSSRFGKFIKLFQDDRKVVGSKIETYLLEQTRIVKPSVYERNYHIFYMILKGLDKEIKDKYYYRDIKEYRYLDTKCYTRSDGISDVDEFYDWKKSMYTMGFTTEEINNIYSLISVILLLGELSLEKIGDDILIRDERTLREISILLDVDSEQFMNKLKYRTMKTKSEEYIINLNKQEVENTINTISKTIYNYLFSWIVERINETLYCEKQDLFIGILDIFGFEVFKNNSFEQLCINFTNEVLQEQFNYFIFKKEQEVYKDENIDWNLIDYPDNKDIINLFLKKPYGIFNILNDCCQLNNNYESFYNTTIKFHDQNEKLILDSKMKSNYKFIIRHYAADVCYSSENFCDKNKHNIHFDVYELFNLIQMPLWKKIMYKINGHNIKKQSINKDTICHKFKNQLLNLMNVIKKTKPHYIRCLKPNDLNIRDNFNKFRVLEQLKYAGVLEAIKIARLGYPIRLYTNDFILRYRTIFKFDTELILNIKKFIGCECLDIQEGKTKIFLKKKVYDSLEKYRYKRLNDVCVIIQSFFRTYKQRCRFKIIQKSILIIQCFKRCLDSRLIFQNLLLNSKSLKIQTLYRRFINQKKYRLYVKKIVLVQSIIRMSVQLKKYKLIKRVHASILISNFYRSASSKKNYKNYKKTIINLQSHLRRKMAKQIYRKKRREYHNIKKLQSKLTEYKNIVIQLKKRVKNDEELIYKYSKRLSFYKKEKKNCSTQTQSIKKISKITQTIPTIPPRVDVLADVIVDITLKKSSKQPKKVTFRDKLEHKKIVKDSGNRIVDRVDIRQHKNRIENNYLLVEEGMRDKLIKKIKKEHIDSINSANRLIDNKNKLINKLNKLLDNYKYKINSLEDASINESKIKRNLIRQIMELKKQYISIL